MFLFIFESLGTSELLLIGILALIFLGPRKMPEYARKAAKLMAEFRGTANEFKRTWENELNFEEESKMLDLAAIESGPIARTASGQPPAEPKIQEVDADKFADLKREADAAANASHSRAVANDPNDKQNWL